MSRRLALIAVFVVLAVAVSARRRAAPPQNLPLDAHRSFAVTEQAILDGFSFERVMTTLAGADALPLYRQWFDTQNPKPGLDASAPHCDDFSFDSRPAYNGFSRRCPTPEGALAKTNPFTPAQYVPLALINRFDMAPADGANCGQYRMVFARTTNEPRDRLHIIFEAVLPNPQPDLGIAGCRAVAEFWARLSNVDSLSDRRAELERFFFSDVLKPEHFSSTSGGGIRTFHNTNDSGVIPRFYQFRLENRCEDGRCRLMMLPDTLENTPPGSFFDATIADERAVRFRAEFLKQIPSLAVRDVNGFSIDIPREYLVGESDPPGRGPVASAAFLEAATTPEGKEFDESIDEELRKLGSSLSSADVVRRAEFQTCVGCHVGSGSIGDGLSFPRSLGFDHVSEARTEQGEAGLRFTLSPAMSDVFIPKRMEILRDFLNFGVPPARSN